LVKSLKGIQKSNSEKYIQHIYYDYLMKKSLLIKKTTDEKINYVQKWVNRKIIFMYFFQLITNFIVLSVGFSGTQIFLLCTENTAEKMDKPNTIKNYLLDHF